MAQTPITLFGLGSMGATLARAYLKANYNLTIWNRTARPVIKELVNQGATFVEDPSDALERTQIVVFCLIGYDALHEVFSKEGVRAALKGKTIINLTNGTPKQAREMKDIMTTFAVKMYLDGGIMATPDMIGTEASQIFVSGELEENVVDAVKGVIATLGKPVWFGPDPGAASLHDLALLAGMYGMFAGGMAAMGLLKKFALQEGKTGVSSKVTGMLIPALVEFAPLLAMIARDFDTGDMAANGFPMGMQMIGLRNVVMACEDEGVEGGC